MHSPCRLFPNKSRSVAHARLDTGSKRINDDLGVKSADQKAGAHAHMLEHTMLHPQEENREEECTPAWLIFNVERGYF